MAFSHTGGTGVASHSSSATSFTLTTSTTAYVAGDMGLLRVATDNISTVDGATNDHTGITGWPGTVTKLGEQTNTVGGAAADGATVSLWYLEAGEDGVPTGTILTIGLSAACVDKAAALNRLTKAAGHLARIVPGTTVQYATADASDNPGSLAFSGLTSGTPYSFQRAIAIEGNTTAALTVSAGFTSYITTRSRNNADAVAIAGEFRNNAATTGETSLPTLPVVKDSASLFVVLEEYIPTGVVGAKAAAAGVAAPTGNSGAFAGVVGAGAGLADGIGAAAAVATAAADSPALAVGQGVSGSIAGSVASANGVAIGSGASVVLAAGSIASAGTATATALAAYHFAGVGVASGGATALGVPVAVSGAVGASAGIGAASGLSGTVWNGVGTAAGLATAAGIGSLTAAGIGTAGGAAAALGTTGVVLGVVGTGKGLASAAAITVDFYDPGIAGRPYRFGGAVRIAASPSSDRSVISVRASRSATSRR